jgi:hypothetical protein
MVGLFVVLITVSAQDYKPQINPLDFTDQIDNPYFSLTPELLLVTRAKQMKGLKLLK